MALPGTQIYLSAATPELAFTRDAVEATLRDLGAEPVYLDQTPLGKPFAECLRERLLECRAVIHIAGHCAGYVDTVGAPATYAEGRRTHAQLEHDLARQMRKELYIFVCIEDFADSSKDTNEPDLPLEPEEMRRLQHAHRARLLDGSHPYREIRTTAELLKHLRPLGRSIKTLTKPLKRRHLPTGLIVILFLVVLLCAVSAVWWKVPRPALLKIHPHRPGIPPSQDPR
ncbi:MAG: hypothetical protein K8R23_18050 [Chthoniobacter sp.]|nr:hypothetical protein [Chthoniobacter sp.]